MTIAVNTARTTDTQPLQAAVVLHDFIEELACSMGCKRLAKFSERVTARIEALEAKAGADLGPNVFRIRDPRGVVSSHAAAEALAKARALRVLLAIATDQPLASTGKVPGPEVFQ